MVDSGLININGELLVFAKFSRFLLLCELDNKKVNFSGTLISINGGVTSTNKRIINDDIKEFFVKRAYQVYLNFGQKISTNQKIIIGNLIKSNIDEYLKTDLGKTVLQDETAEITNTFSYKCDCCNNTMSEPDGFLLRTFEFIQSRKYWKEIFDILGIGNKEDLHLAARIAYFEGICSYNSPWIICKECMPKFDYVDKVKAKRLMKIWIEKKGEFNLKENGDFQKFLTKTELLKIIEMVVTIT